MGFNTYPPNPFPPNSEQMDVDTLKAEINELKSGLTNYQTQNNINLEVPNRKNLMSVTWDNIKVSNTGGTWNGNVYTDHGVSFTVQTDNNGNIIGIKAEGTATESASIALCNNYTSNVYELDGKDVIMSGCPAGGSSDTYHIYGWRVTSDQKSKVDYGEGVSFTAINKVNNWGISITIVGGYEIPSGGLTFYPMLRLASVTDPTFAPYIPSVESRIEAVESGLYGRKLLFETDSTGTYADKLDSIFAVFNNLTESQKMRACITYYSTVLTMSTSPNFSSLPYYESDDSAPRGYSAMLKNSGSTLYKFVYGASGTTVTDMSAQTASVTLKLYLLS